MSKFHHKDTIMNFLKENHDKKFSMLELSKQTGVGYLTVIKYVIILSNENLINVEDFKSIKIISYKEPIAEVVQ